MNRSIALATLASVALVPATAEARGSKVYRGSFTLVSVEGDYVSGKVGKAQLVDGKRNDKLSVHVRQLAARTSYTYRLQEGTCREGAPGGTDVAGWRYGKLVTNRAGVANATARSRTFRARKRTRYAVVVYSGDRVLLCAQLRTKGSGHRQAKGDNAPGRAQEKARGKSEQAPGRAEDKTRGKSEQAPGHAEDKTRGKSEQAPGHAEDKARGKSGGKPRSRRAR